LNVSICVSYLTIGNSDSGTEEMKKGINCSCQPHNPRGIHNSGLGLRSPGLPGPDNISRVIWICCNTFSVPCRRSQIVFKRHCANDVLVVQFRERKLRGKNNGEILTKLDNIHGASIFYVSAHHLISTSYYDCDSSLMILWT